MFPRRLKEDGLSLLWDGRLAKFSPQLDAAGRDERLQFRHQGCCCGNLSAIANAILGSFLS